MKLAGRDVELFLNIVRQNLRGQKTLDSKLRYTLDNMNLAACSEIHKELYLRVMDTVSELPQISENDLKWAYKLLTRTVKLVSTRKKEKLVRSSELYDQRKLDKLVRSCKSLTNITEAISEDRVISIFFVIELLLYVFFHHTPTNEEQQIFIGTFTEACVNKKIQKVSRQHLHSIISGLKYSNLEKSKQLITLLTEIEKSEEMCTNNENVIIKRHKVITITKYKEYKHLYIFKHPLSVACTKSDSKCGFILKDSIQEYNRTYKLCTDKYEYKDTGIHLHNVISAGDMYFYETYTGKCEGKQITVAGWWMWWKDWLPHITDWKCTGGYVVYNVSDYLVAKR